MTDVRLTRLQPLNPPKRKGDSLILARFDAVVGEAVLPSCALVETYGNRHVWGPGHGIRFGRPLTAFLNRIVTEALEAGEPIE